MSMTQCHGVAQAQVEATFVRHGPFGTAAGFSADPSDEVKLAVAVTYSGNCRAASSIIFEGGRRPVKRFRALPRALKRVA